MRQEDELILLARGLGLIRLVTNLLHSYDVAGNNLIVVVGADERENNWIAEALAEHAAMNMSPSQARGLKVVNTNLMNVGKRKEMYEKGGIFSVTSQILVVDFLLPAMLDPAQVTGLVVLHADRVTALSTEAFILRIFRQHNKMGFLKAFSDNPDPFTIGFAPLKTMMGNLFLRKISIWPRYQTTIARSLEGRKKAEVIELAIPMTEAMSDIQNAIMECVEVSIKELKKANTGLEMDNWTTDSALHKNFDAIIRRQLDPVWHRVSLKTKQLVRDLAVLRGMLHTLLTYDSATFNRQLDAILAAHQPPPGSTRQNQSPWLFLDAAHTIFDTAKRRVYTGNAGATTNNGSLDSLHPVLEELPKWSQLSEVLDEIDRDMYFSPVLKDDSNGTILIMCGDSTSCRQLKEYLGSMHVKIQTSDDQDDHEAESAYSASFMMRGKLRNYLSWKKRFAKVSASLYEANQKALDGAQDSRNGGNSLRGRAPANKRRRIRGGGSLGTISTRAANGSLQAADEQPLQVESLLAEMQPNDEEALQKAEVVVDPLDDMEGFYELYEMKDLVVVHAYDGDMDDHVLEEVKPRYVIMYEPDASFVRRVEVYRSSHNDRNVKVYVMYYGGSVEEQRFHSAIRREKDAFARVINEKKSMAITITLDAHGVEDPQEAFLRTINTRIAGGGRLAATSQPPRVVVDLREFRSSLPSLLHARSMDVVPCMLTVGDYILSPNICVERKSIKDLISSFKDGRLYAQAETMLQHYKSPMLLIEFDQNKSFTLEPFADLSGSLSSVSAANATSDLQSKLVLLTLAFPRLKLIWSSSPYQTAEIFENLKSQEEEPDPITASRLGLEKDQMAEDQAYSREPQDMLRTVPGITAKNIKSLVLEAENIREVSNMSVDDLEPLIGRTAGRQVHGFFNRSLID